MKVLILSCNTGEGHNSSAQALYDKLKREHIDCEFKDTLLFSSKKTSKKVSKVYTWVTTKFPPLFNIAYKLGSLISSPHRKSPVYYANRKYADNLYRYIIDQNFDCILSFHLFPAQSLTYLREKYDLKLLMIAVATDYTCIPFWEETKMDYYIVGHSALVPEFAEKGIPVQKIIASGIPVHEKFLEITDQSLAKKKLGLAVEKKTVLIMTGSMGFGKIDRIIQNLLDGYKEQINIVVLCGRNEKLISKLKYLFEAYKNVYLKEFTKQIPLFFDASDVLFTKPGGLSTTEAAVKNVPIIHMAEIPGCETQNRKFFNDLQMSFYIQHSDDAYPLVEAVLNGKSEAMKKNQSLEINKNSTHDLFLFIQDQIKRNKIS